MPNVRFVLFEQDRDFPTEELTRIVQKALSERKESRVAIFAESDLPYALPNLNAKTLEARVSYNWSGYLHQKKIDKPPGRVLIGDYSEWFQWYMRHLRFRTFHTVVLIEPHVAVSNERYGGYIDGLLARLMTKVRRLVIVAREPENALPMPDETRVKAVMTALLYGTRLGRPELIEQASHTLIPIPRELLEKTFQTYKYHWRISKGHPRFRLREFDEELLQGMVQEAPDDYIDGKPDQIRQLFWRKRRFRRELRVPDEMLRENALETINRMGWATAPYSAKKASEWLERLNKKLDSRLEDIYRKHEDADDQQWLAMLSPTREQVERVLEELVVEGKLERKRWVREVGRPASAYHLPGKAPFLESRCGQCAFYVSVKRRCRLWWLVNKRQVFYDGRWKQPGSTVARFELHKMRWASRMGPHSSACQRFIDKKRDHNRKAIPVSCEICGKAIRPRKDGRGATCGTCSTRYVRFKDKVKVLTAYEHEYERLYREITGRDAKEDLEVWRRDLKSKLPFVLQRKIPVDELEVLAEDEETVEPPRVWPSFDRGLQEKVNRLAGAADTAKQLSKAMGQSAINATRRIIEFAELRPSEVGQAIALQEKYLAQIDAATPRRLLTLEALIMNQYWRCYGAALKDAQQWFGPRKRSRFVREYIEDPAGRARGYSPADAAINYLHQRRLRQAERINAQAGFPGTCDGFLHGERYNSRGIGLLLDMIDPFKFADREELLMIVLNGGISWTDFRLETDRRGLTFYYPNTRGVSILSRAGADADNMAVSYQNRQMRISEAFRELASNLLQALEAGSRNSQKFVPFVYM